MAFGYPVFLELADRLTVVIGESAVRAGKAETLLDAGARVTVVATGPERRLEQLEGRGASVRRRDYLSGDLAGAFRRLFDGEKINVTEGRAVLHTALRGDLSSAPAAREAHAVAADVRQRMRGLIEALEASDVTDIVSVGIGEEPVLRWNELGERLLDQLAKARHEMYARSDRPP